MQLTERHHQYWSAESSDHRDLAVHLVFCDLRAGLFRPRPDFTFFGWPFSFWVGAQGALIVYCVIIWFYARYMNNLDNQHGVQEDEEE